MISALEQIGTDEAIDKIRSALENKCRWSQTPYIYGLGIVADPAMVEHLIYLLYDHETTDLCLEAIDTLEHIGGEKVFDWLHQSMYWISNKADRVYGPFDKIVEALFKLDRDRTLIALAGAIQSYDPIVRKCAAIALSDCYIPIDDRNITILLNALDDPDPDVQLKIVGCIRYTIDLIFPIVLELASNSELVAILISTLERLADRDPHAPIFSNFHLDRNIGLNFIETAEKTCIENIRNKTHHVNDEIFALREIGNDLAITALQEILEAGNNYDDVDQSIPTLARIGTERSMSVLLSFFLPNANIFYGWIAIQFHNLGKLGLIPQLQSAQRQVYSERSSELIETIQKREGLYNPDFSDRSHPLFEPPSPRLRDILLGNTATAIET